MNINEKLWDFPCQLPLKIMGPADAPLREAVERIVLTHTPDFDVNTIEIRLSRNGKYQSLTISTYVTHKEQVLGLYADLAKHQQDTGHISLVL